MYIIFLLLVAVTQGTSNQADNICYRNCFGNRNFATCKGLNKFTSIVDGNEEKYLTSIKVSYYTKSITYFVMDNNTLDLLDQFKTFKYYWNMKLELKFYNDKIDKCKIYKCETSYKCTDNRYRDCLSYIFVININNCPSSFDKIFNTYNYINYLNWLKI